MTIGRRLVGHVTTWHAVLQYPGITALVVASPTPGSTGAFTLIVKPDSNSVSRDVIRRLRIRGCHHRPPAGRVGSPAAARGDAGSRGGCRAGAARSVRSSPTSQQFARFISTPISSLPLSLPARTRLRRAMRQSQTADPLAGRRERGDATTGRAMAEHRAARTSPKPSVGLV